MATFNVFVPKANHSFKIDEAKMPKVSVEYAHDYGWRQCLVDSTASIKRENFSTEALFVAAAMTKAKAKMAALVAGTVSIPRSAVDVEAVYAATLGITVTQLRALTAKVGVEKPVNGPLPTATPAQS
jgi:hypothetical protein